MLEIECCIVNFVVEEMEVFKCVLACWQSDFIFIVKSLWVVWEFFGVDIEFIQFVLEVWIVNDLVIVSLLLVFMVDWVNWWGIVVNKEWFECIF